MDGKHFQDYYKRLAKESILKAVLCGLVVGFIALFITAAFFWFFGVQQVWLVAIVFAVAFGASAPLFYYKRFKPTTKMIAKRVDAMGLEERLLTMTELEGDQSYIAKRQREDALAALKTVKASWVKIAVSVPLIIAVAVSCVFGAGMTTVSVLAARGVIESGGNIINPPEDDTPKEITVSYEVEEGEGEIVGVDGGEPFQIVMEGDDASPVMAVPEDGWAFVQWSDGLEYPYRQDFAIKESMTIYAIFGELQEDEGEGEGEGEEGDESSDKPPKDGESNGKDSQESDKQGPGAGGDYVANNQIKDGKTELEDAVFDNAYEDAVEDMNESGDYTDEDKKIIGGYFDSIRK